MARRSWVWDPQLKMLVEITPGAIPEQRAPTVLGDLPGYVSPASGLWVEGRKARREDMKRTNSRPWEGLQAEKQEAARHKAYADERSDARLHDHVSRVYHQMPDSKRRILEG